MGYQKLILLLIICCFISMLHNSAEAAGRLRFDSTLSAQSRVMLGAFLTKLQNISLEDVSVAKVDLNDDGLDELILLETACTKTEGPCNYMVIAETGNKMTSIASIIAHEVMLGNSYTHGIRDILARANPQNDFDLQRYIWDPERSRYTIDAGGS